MSGDISGAAQVDPVTAGPPAGEAAGTRPTAEVQGLVDTANPARLAGWARNLQDPAERLTIALRLGRRTLASTRADRQRPDLAKNGIGDGCYAFDLPLIPAWAPHHADLAVVAVAADGSETPLPMRLRRGDIDPDGSLFRVLEATSSMHRRILEEVRSVAARAERLDTQRDEAVRRLEERLETLAVWLARLDERLAAAPVVEHRPRPAVDRWQGVLAVLLGLVLGAVALGTVLLLRG